jgi:hypothetical protein
MGDAPVDERVLEFYYYGFYAVLKRFRSVALLGWLVVLLGVGAFFLGWDVSRPRGWIDLVLCCGGVVCGIAVVQIAIGALNAYVRIPFPSPGDADGEKSEFVECSREIMKEVEEGGWREAQAAIRAVENLGVRYGLPVPERRGLPRR